jgi:hypothetical protein
MKLILLLAAALVLPFTACAQNLSPSETSLKKALDDCMARVSNGKADDAFTTIFSELWKDKASASQAAASMQRQYREVLGRVQDTMGEPIPGGYEFIGVKRLGTSVLKVVYLQKNELFFLPWAFSFYRPAEDWRLTYISFPDVGSDDLKDFIVLDLAKPMPTGAVLKRGQ